MLVPVCSSPRKFSTEQELYDCALRALMRRAHSIHELKEYLHRRAEDAELVSAVVARLRDQNYLDDARYALDFARAHAQTRRQGRFRVARELRSRGVPDRYIEAALESVFAETDEAALVRARIQRRLSNIRGLLGQRPRGQLKIDQRRLDQKTIASLYRNLLAAGFPSDLIRAEIRSVTRADLDALPDELAANESTPE